MPMHWDAKPGQLRRLRIQYGKNEGAFIVWICPGCGIPRPGGYEWKGRKGTLPIKSIDWFPQDFCSLPCAVAFELRGEQAAPAVRDEQ